MYVFEIGYNAFLIYVRCVNEVAYIFTIFEIKLVIAELFNVKFSTLRSVAALLQTPPENIEKVLK